MTVPREYADRDDAQLAILEALVDRPEEGMTVFELRTHVGEDIDAIEAALAELKQDGLIEVTERSGDGGSTVITPADRVVPPRPEDAEPTTLERLREHLPF